MQTLHHRAYFYNRKGKRTNFLQKKAGISADAGFLFLGVSMGSFGHMVVLSFLFQSRDWVDGCFDRSLAPSHFG